MSLNHLIILPCHGIWKGTNDGQLSEDWLLESFQIEGNDHLAFIEQIRTSIDLLNKDPHSFLLFSGGQTKQIAGPVSESQSYYKLAEKLNLINEANSSRINTEEFAKDSFENVLFSIARYFELFSSYKSLTKLTIVGFEFKRQRFLELHLPALKLSSNSSLVINYIGNSPTPPYETGSQQFVSYFSDLKTAESNNAIKLFETDPFGNKSVLKSKKLKRNPFKRFDSYPVTNPKLAPVLLNDSLPDSYKFPWEE